MAKSLAEEMPHVFLPSRFVSSIIITSLVYDAMMTPPGVVYLNVGRD